MPYTSDSVARADQAEAAERDLSRVLETTAQAVGLTAEQAAPSRWLTEQLGRFIRDLATGRVRACEHLAGGPRPGFATLSTPGLVVCQLCHDLLFADDTDRVCDHCHQPAADLYVTAVQLGRVALLVIECPTCLNPTTHDTP